MEHALDHNLNRMWIEAIYKRALGHLRHTCFLICNNEEDARDCVQEAFIAAMIHPPFKDEGAAATYIYVVAKHAAIKILRRRSVQYRNTELLQQLFPAEGLPKEGLFSYHPVSGALQDMLRKLTDDNRLAIVAFMYSIPMRKLSHIYDMSESSMHQRLKSALKQLRLMLKGEVHDKARKAGRTQVNDDIYRMRKNGLSFNEIAQRVKMAPNKVISRFHRYVELVRKYPDQFKDMKQYHNMVPTRHHRYLNPQS